MKARRYSVAAFLAYIYIFNLATGMTMTIATSDILKLKVELNSIAARTCRGETATKQDKLYALSLIQELESQNPTFAPARSATGKWDLVYTNTQLFRSSPFFMAARSVCKDGEEAERFNYFCDLHREALRFTTIGRVSQIVTSTELVSEFESNVAIAPGLPIVVKGTITSFADIEEINDYYWTLHLNTVKIKEGTSNIPIISNVLDSFSGLPLRSISQLIESNIDSYTVPKPKFRTLYVDDDSRISRDQDDNIFFYRKLFN